jgi:hypothetical protein
MGPGTRTSKQVTETLKREGVGGWFGRGIRLFDESYWIPTTDWMNQRVADAVARLKREDLDPATDYAPDGSDCDNWALIIAAEVSKQWIHQNKDRRGGYPSLAFGIAVAPGHALNIGITTEGVRYWNYGQYVPAWDGQITEVDFK